MMTMTLWLLLGVLVWDMASCSINCPDGTVCTDDQTCCLTDQGYSCCPYPNAVCCADEAHCCPSGYRCNLVTMMCEKQGQPWMTRPMMKKEEPEEKPSSLVPLEEIQNNHLPEPERSSVVHCDNIYVCLDGNTCCRHPTGVWFCCPYSPGRCCLDGYHCCPYGYDCDLTYTRCVRQILSYPFFNQPALSSVPASRISPPEDDAKPRETPMRALTEASFNAADSGVIRCDSKFYCGAKTSCCKDLTGQWSCCPYQLGQCCSDGQHCCEYSYTCDSTSMTCKGFYSQVPSGSRQKAKLL
ncbi:granulins-like [Cynoglossus semilaevis]|uniref:Granulins-like n=1 Tax=Cynoglossus semilaevis TaxID=244447 RepID=A0A3P8W559_CYNSE|nr:granulins-like [Cynoglossus semilaevis]